MKRNFKKPLSLKDFRVLDKPKPITTQFPVSPPNESLSILRMMIRPKYGLLRMPSQLFWLPRCLGEIINYDREMYGISSSWCYLTIRHGEQRFESDDIWHFDGVSFRDECIPDRNYIWVDGDPTEYKTGSVSFPPDFDPLKHNIFDFCDKATKDSKIRKIKPRQWHFLSPFCLHRRPPTDRGGMRTFIRVSFLDVEIRDVNNTQNPLMPTQHYGRDPVRSFRNKLVNYGE